MPGDDFQSSLERAEEMEDRLVDFAVRIGILAEELPSTRFGKHICGQIIRSGSSPAPNYGETAAAVSRDDFIHKLAVVFKELRETRVWLKIVRRGKMLPPARLGRHLRRVPAVLQFCRQVPEDRASQQEQAASNTTTAKVIRLHAQRIASTPKNYNLQSATYNSPDPNA